MTRRVRGMYRNWGGCVVDVLQCEFEAVADHGLVGHLAIARGPETSGEVQTFERYN